MMLKSRKCCCDTVTCTIFTDDTALANFTEETSGDWTKPASQIQTTEATTWIEHDTPHPESLSTGTVGLDSLTLPAAGATVRLQLAKLDNSNYLFAEYEVILPGPTAGVDVAFRLGYCQGGADTILEEYGYHSVGNGATTSVTLADQGLCYNGSLLSFRGPGVSIVSDTVSGMDSPLDISGLTLGTQVGIEVLANAGTVGFENMSFYGVNGISCITCLGACQYCSTGNVSGTPSEYSAYFLGVTNGSCASCVAHYDGVTFIIPAREDESVTGGNDYTTRGCMFAEETPGPCDVINYKFRLKINDTVSLERIRLDVEGGDGLFQFAKTSGICTETLVDSAGTNAGLGRCNWTGCACTITPNMA